jgi:hypothetical protein
MTETKKEVCQFNSSRKQGVYSVNSECDFFKLTEKIHFKGFNSLPKGFFREGYGFAKPAGTFLKSALLEGFGEKIQLHISNSGNSGARKQGKKWHVVINHQDYLKILEGLRDLNKEKNIKSNAHVAHTLATLFPRKFGSAKEVPSIYTYEKNKISKILESKKDVHKELTKADIDAIAELYSKVANQKQVEFNSIGIAEDAKRKNETIYLTSVIKEFKKKIANKALSEADWQKFVGNYVLLFNTSYVNVIDKLNIDLRGKYPDFVLVNLYGYIDIYEIKKPHTNLMKHDDGRDNYYWDAEVSRAIIQTEKYVQMLQKQALEVREIIKEKYKLDVKVVRPRGYVVVGNSSQFSNDKMNDDFRILASASKNVDIVLYDELLKNLENLLVRLKKKVKSAPEKRSKKR